MLSELKTPEARERRAISWRRAAFGPVVSLVIPALNEAEGLSEILPRVPDLVDEIIVVDGGSTDGTESAVFAARPDAIVVRQSGRGKGAALKEGLFVARGEILVTMDADGSMNPEDILSFVGAIRSGFDFVKGSRSLAGAGSADFTMLRSIGNSGLTSVANLMFKSRYTDITFGFNAYSRSTMERLGNLEDGFQYEIQAALRAVSAGMKTAEVACYEPARVGGESKLNPLRDGWAILRVIVDEAREQRRARRGSPKSAEFAEQLVAF